MGQLRTVALGVLIVTSAACGSSGGSGAAGDTDVPAAGTAALSRAADCDELLDAIRADARAKIRAQADELRIDGWHYAGIDGEFRGSPTPVSTPAAAPTLAPGDGSAPPTGATDTNTQVPGVDEADVVEIAGGRLYLLGDGQLSILTAVPPDATALAERVPIEGAPLGMFVANGRALVVSFVVDDGALGGDRRCDTIGGPLPLPVAQSFVPPFHPECSSLFTKLTLLDVGAAPARVVRETYLEGNYLAARRHGTRARVIVQRGWGTPVALPDPWDTLSSWRAHDGPTGFVGLVDAWEATALAAIDASVIGDWLPAVRERVDGALVERPLTCNRAEIPPAAETPQGSTLIVGLDLAAEDAPLDDTLVLGGAAEIHANADTLVLAQPVWSRMPLGEADTRTALHVFGLPPDGSGVAYLGSGFVAGHVLSQFSLDVQGDVVRLATTFVHAQRGTTVTRVTTARVRDGVLHTLGTSADLAPGERLQAARFLGDRAYLVTFVQIDPLFVVDLADPANPRVLGEVELPGFSQYLHPLDTGHLLTIGRDGTMGGELSGPALRLFDVTDPTTPRVTSTYRLPPNADSMAQHDHLAFTFDPQRGLLALPVNLWEPGSRATLQLFDVDTTAGITRLGVVDHGVPRSVPCAPPYDFEMCQTYETMQRGVFIGDAVYSISTSQVQVHALDDLGQPLATLVLP